MTARIERLEGADLARPLIFVWVDAGCPAEAEATAARLEVEGRRAILVRWQWDEGEG